MSINKRKWKVETPINVDFLKIVQFFFDNSITSYLVKKIYDWRFVLIKSNARQWLSERNVIHLYDAFAKQITKFNFFLTLNVSVEFMGLIN